MNFIILFGKTNDEQRIWKVYIWLVTKIKPWFARKNDKLCFNYRRSYL